MQTHSTVIDSGDFDITEEDDDVVTAALAAIAALDRELRGTPRGHAVLLGGALEEAPSIAGELVVNLDAIDARPAEFGVTHGARRSDNTPRTAFEVAPSRA